MMTDNISQTGMAFCRPHQSRFEKIRGSIRSNIMRWWTAAALALSLVFAAISASAQTQDYVGFWWKPTESGWGLTIQQQGTSTFAVWFTYDAQGAAIWHTLTCNFSGTPKSP